MAIIYIVQNMQVKDTFNDIIEKLICQAEPKDPSSR